jgi:ElaB/YqjD/DUF883 family membrane-anchored ribosome-binding protein
MDARATPLDMAAGLDTGRVLDYPTTPAATEDLQILISTIEDLLVRLHAAADSEVGRLRVRTANAVVRVKAAVARDGIPLTQRRPIAKEGRMNVRVYMHERPWVTLGLMALLVLSIGLYAGRSVAERW